MWNELREGKNWNGDKREWLCMERRERCGAEGGCDPWEVGEIGVDEADVLMWRPLAET